LQKNRWSGYLIKDLIKLSKLTRSDSNSFPLRAKIELRAINIFLEGWYLASRPFSIIETDQTCPQNRAIVILFTPVVKWGLCSPQENTKKVSRGQFF
jgi:hypothetical protein